jgi:hypothetical protein
MSLPMVDSASDDDFLAGLTSPDDQGANGDAGGLSDRLLNSVSAPQAAAAAKAGDDAAMDVDAVWGRVQTSVKAFLSLNDLKKPIRIHKTYRDTVDCAWEKLSSIVGAHSILDDVGLHDVVACVCACVVKGYDCEWVHLANKLADHIREKKELPATVSEVFTVSSLQTFATLRARYIVGILTEMTSSGGPLSASSGVFQRLAKGLSDGGQTVPDSDILVIERAAGTSEREMCKVWTEILSQCCSGSSGKAINIAFSSAAKLLHDKEKQQPEKRDAQGAAVARAQEAEASRDDDETSPASPESIVDLHELHYFKKAQDIQEPQPVAKRGRRTPAAAGVTGAVLPAQTVPVISVKSEAVSIPWLKLVCDAVQSEIWAMEFGKAPHAVSLDIFSEKPKVLPSQDLDPESPLMFAGEVHWQCNPPCFKVCELSLKDDDGKVVMNLPLYVNGHRHNSIGSEVVVPAWLARSTLVAGEQPNMEAHRITVGVNLDHIKLNDHPCKSLSVSLPCLKLASNCSPSDPELLYSCPPDLISSAGQQRKRGRGNGHSSVVADEFVDLLGPMACVKECKENSELDGQQAGNAKPKARAKAKKEVEHLLK